MLIKLTNLQNKKFLLNTDLIFEVEEHTEEGTAAKSMIRLINNRESVVKETISVIYKKSYEHLNGQKDANE